MTDIGKAGTGGEPNITSSNNSNFHLKIIKINHKKSNKTIIDINFYKFSILILSLKSIFLH